LGLYKSVTLRVDFIAFLAEMARRNALVREVYAKKLGQRIRTLRESKGISLKHFESKENSMNRHSLSDIEQGKKVPNLYTLYRISKLLEIPIEDFVTKLD
jgi:DNA-binding XRE family transcriptional regulator